MFIKLLGVGLILGLVYSRTQSIAVVLIVLAMGLFVAGPRLLIGND